MYLLVVVLRIHYKTLSLLIMRLLTIQKKTKKVQPLITHFNNAFTNAFSDDFDQSIDRLINKFKRRCFVIQYLQLKSITLRFK